MEGIELRGESCRRNGSLHYPAVRINDFLKTIKMKNISVKANHKLQRVLTCFVFLKQKLETSYGSERDLASLKRVHSPSIKRYSEKVQYLCAHGAKAWRHILWNISVTRPQRFISNQYPDG